METDQFCPKCGAKAIKEKRCPDCGALLREGTKFCHKCGCPVSGADKGHKTTDETIDIPIDAIERNILTETEAEIKASQSRKSAPRRTSVQASSRSSSSRSTPSRSASPGSASSHGGNSAPSRQTSAKNASPEHPSNRGASSKSSMAHSTSVRSSSSRGESSGRGMARRGGEYEEDWEELPKKRKSSAPVPPRSRRMDYRDEDWEEEDWEEDEIDEEEDYEEDDWDEDDWDDDEDDEGVDVITIMTAVVGCVLLIVVAVLGFNLFKHYIPKNYGDGAEEQVEQSDDTQGEEQAPEEEQEQQEAQEIEADSGREAYTLTVTSEKVNVRDQPSTSGTNVLKVAYQGETYNCNGSAGDGEWYEITLEDGTTGYVFQKYVSVE